MSKAIWPSFIGKTIARWQILEKVSTDANGQVRVRCRCVCGTERNVKFQAIRNGDSTSCGCFAVETLIDRSTKHGDSRRKSRASEYVVWADIVKRCTNPNHKYFDRYGGRGITVAPEWTGVGGYENFISHAGKKPYARATIDRIDNNSGYWPGNVQWTTQKEQCRNRSSNRLITIQGETLPLVVWCERCGKDYKNAHYQLQRGRAIEDILGLSR